MLEVNKKLNSTIFFPINKKTNRSLWNIGIEIMVKKNCGQSYGPPRH